MGRGRGADDIFYGSELPASKETFSPEESARADTALWKLGDLLRDYPRDQLTLRRSLAGDYLLSHHRPYSLFRSNKTVGPSKFIALELALGSDDEVVVEAKVYGDNMSIPRHMRDEVIYSGHSLEEAYKAGKEQSAKWAKEIGFSSPGKYFDVTLAHLRDSIDVLLERAIGS